MGDNELPPMSLRIVQPCEALRPYVSGYYVSEIDSAVPITDLSVPEWGSIRLIYAGGFAVETGFDAGQFIRNSVVQGPSSKAVGFTIQFCHMVGIGLLPAGFARLWNADIGRITDRSRPLESMIGDAVPKLIGAIGNARSIDDRFGIAESYLLTRLRDTPPNAASEEVSRIQALLNNPMIGDAEQLARAMGRNPSALARLCKKHFGFAPKLLLRRQRFLRMLDALHARPYAEWPEFLDPQYTDQSHMIRDFRYFMGTSPTRYLALPRMVQKASAAHRSAALGSALQGLA